MDEILARMMARLLHADHRLTSSSEGVTLTIPQTILSLDRAELGAIDAVLRERNAAAIALAVARTNASAGRWGDGDDRRFYGGGG